MYEQNSEAVTTVNVKPLETFYSFPVMKADLLKVADVIMGIVGEDDRLAVQFNFNEDEVFDGEYPQSVLDQIDKQVERILKGDKEFASVDAALGARIEQIVRDNITEGVMAIGMKIREAAPELSKWRSEIIASTEVTDATEAVRDNIYLNDPNFTGGTEEWQTSLQDVCPICRGYESLGRIAIGSGYNHPTIQGRSDYRPPAHPYCRCNRQFYPPVEPVQVDNSINVSLAGGMNKKPVQYSNSYNYPEMYEELGIEINKLQCVMTNFTIDAEPLADIFDDSDLYYSDTMEWVKGLVISHKPHCTMLYGLMESVKKEHVELVLKDYSIPDYSIESFSYFESGNGEEYYTIVAKILLTREVYEGHKRLSLLPHVNTFMDYEAHMTVAYIKKDEDKLAEYLNKLADQANIDLKVKNVALDNDILDI